jgi:DNA repair protein RecO (recombination protein O)
VTQLSASATLCAILPHGETGAIVRALTGEAGLIAGYVNGARGRALRPVLIAGNRIRGEWRQRAGAGLSRLTLELEHGRAHLLSEPLAAAGINWATALTAATLPEGHPYPNLHAALDGLLSAIEHAPAARGWAGAMARYEELLLAELGYGAALGNPDEPVAALARNRERLVAHMLGEHRHRDVMAARERLVERLKRAVA